MLIFLLLYKIKHVPLLKLKIKLLVFNFMTKRYVDSIHVQDNNC